MMSADKRARLEVAGWQFGTVEDFLKANLSGEKKMHEAGSCPKDPDHCYPCYEEELESAVLRQTNSLAEG